MVKDYEKYRNTPRFERGANDYLGPEFSSLDEVECFMAIFILLESLNRPHGVFEGIWSERRGGRFRRALLT